MSSFTIVLSALCSDFLDQWQDIAPNRSIENQLYQQGQFL